MVHMRVHETRHVRIVEAELTETEQRPTGRDYAPTYWPTTLHVEYRWFETDDAWQPVVIELYGRLVQRNGTTTVTGHRESMILAVDYPGWLDVLVGLLTPTDPPELLRDTATVACDEVPR